MQILHFCTKTVFSWHIAVPVKNRKLNVLKDTTDAETQNRPIIKHRSMDMTTQPLLLTVQERLQKAKTVQHTDKGKKACSAFQGHAIQLGYKVQTNPSHVDYQKAHNEACFLMSNTVH